jgi:hypothetical protein
MLTDTGIRAARPAQKPLKLFDENGLYLVVMSTSGRLWRFKYRFPKGDPLRTEKLLSLGSHPDVSLRAAREKRADARQDCANGIDATVKRKCEQASAADAVECTIQPHQRRRARQREPMSAATVGTMARPLELYVIPYIGACRVETITAPQLLEIIPRMEPRRTFELAHRLRSICSRVLRYAKATGRQCEDLPADLIGQLTPVEPEHMAAIVDPIEISGLLRAVEGSHEELLTRLRWVAPPRAWTTAARSAWTEELVEHAGVLVLASEDVDEGGPEVRMAAQPVEDRRVQSAGVRQPCRSGVDPVRANLAVAESVGSSERSVSGMPAGAVGVLDVDVGGDLADVVQQGGAGDPGGLRFCLGRVGLRRNSCRQQARLAQLQRDGDGLEAVIQHATGIGVMMGRRRPGAAASRWYTGRVDHDLYPPHVPRTSTNDWAPDSV